MLTIVAERTIKKGKREEYIELVKKVQEGSLKEKGCLVYNLCENPDDPQKFAMFEKWESQEILDAHLETAHFKEFMEKAAEVTEERHVRVYSVLL